MFQLQLKATNINTAQHKESLSGILKAGFNGILNIQIYIIVKKSFRILLAILFARILR